MRGCRCFLACVGGSCSPRGQRSPADRLQLHICAFEAHMVSLCTNRFSCTTVAFALRPVDQMTVIDRFKNTWCLIRGLFAPLSFPPLTACFVSRGQPPTYWPEALQDMTPHSQLHMDSVRWSGRYHVVRPTSVANFCLRGSGKWPRKRQSFERAIKTRGIQGIQDSLLLPNEVDCLLKYQAKSGSPSEAQREPTYIDY